MNAVLEKINKFRITLLVWIGILLTVASAIITNNILEKNNKEISRINQEISVIERQIENRWQLVQDAGQKLDSAINVVASKSIIQISGDSDIIADYFYDWFSLNLGKSKKISKNSNIKDYINLVSSFKKKSINDIDDLYLQKVTLESERQEIIDDNMFLKNLALFFQILGLILVLSKSF